MLVHVTGSSSLVEKCPEIFQALPQPRIQFKNRPAECKLLHEHVFDIDPLLANFANMYVHCRLARKVKHGRNYLGQDACLQGRIGSNMDGIFLPNMQGRTWTE